MVVFNHDVEIWELASVVAMAFNDPKQIKSLRPRAKRAEEINMDDLPGMLRIPKKKKKQAA